MQLEVNRMHLHNPAKDRFAPGWPGIPARWTSSAKTGVGTALSPKSKVWFTLSHGIFNEIYYPCIDQACTRDMGLIVTDGQDFFSEEKRHADSQIEWLAEGVPGFRLVNTCREGRYHIEKQVVTDPHRDTVLQQVRFSATDGVLSDYHLYVLLAPHLGNCGAGNTVWLDDFDGTPLLMAVREDRALALACSAAWLKRSAGFVGVSDGWQDLQAHREMTWEYTRAENGNVALAAEIDLSGSEGDFVLALGFGRDPGEAAQSATSSLQDGFDKAKRDYIAGWKDWAKKHSSEIGGDPGQNELSEISLAVLRTHESKSTPGGIIASLSVPWGFSKGDDDLGGYHLVWPRDMVQSAGGLLAAGARDDVRRVLSFLKETQRPDGHWSQNMWLDGSPYWDGIQMDETALPILLVDLAHRHKVLSKSTAARYWPMVRQAAQYLVINGPVSPEDRWEEDPGYSPFTVAAEIAALLAAADLADLNDESSTAAYLRETADVWYASIDRWMYASGTDWCEEFGVEGYYVRIAPMDPDDGATSLDGTVILKNVPAAEDHREAVHLVSPDALAFVRFGLRSPDDPRIQDTAKVIDALLKVETSSGPAWHRYNDDGYGEHADGSPFDGTGIGRGWPLLTGERGHFELAAGRTQGAKELLAAMESFANEGGLIPEQIWDAPDIPELELFFGQPSGSAMPLVWAHAEYLRLRRSLRDGSVFDLPPQTVQRYLREKTVSSRVVWRFNHKIRSMQAGKSLRIETLAPGVIHWTGNEWDSTESVKTLDVGLGVHVADLATERMPEGTQVVFTIFWPEADRWEGTDFIIRIEAL